MICPKCGSEMIKRLAKKGRNAGNYFWGCSNYPVCKNIIDIKYDSDGQNNEVTSNEIFSDIKYREFFARPITDNHDVYFFNSLGTSYSEVQEAAYDSNKANILRGFSKFRIDISATRINNSYDDSRISSLILRLLNRAHITYISPDTENKLIQLFKVQKQKNPNLGILDNFIDYNNVEFTTDSETEKKFIEYHLKQILGSNWASHVLTQVHLGSLVDNIDVGEMSQRVDFLISSNGTNFIIELDGEEHQSHKEKDKKRDLALLQSGYEVIRIPNDDIFDMNSREITNFRSAIKFTKEVSIFEPHDKYIIAIKVIHQLQIAIAKAVEKDFLTLDGEVCIQLNTKAFSDEEVTKILEFAISELKTLYSIFFKLYRIESVFKITIACKEKSNQNSLEISFANKSSNLNQMIISDISFKDEYFCQIDSFDEIADIDPDENSLKKLMKYLFRFEEFQEGQLEAIERLLTKKDSIVLLPTGSGKSLIYQLTSFIVPGQTVIISPITSLMDDQLDNLLFKGIDNAIAIYSSFDWKQKELKQTLMKLNNICLVYISPERLQMKSFRDEIRAMLVQNSIFTVAIDEAHCVSEWGHDFRTAYLNIGRNSREIFKKNNNIPVILALTGTASTAVLKDVQREVGIIDYDGIITPQTFDRKELKFNIFSTSSDSKINTVAELVKKVLPQRFNVSLSTFILNNREDAYCGIVFCPHVNGDYGAFPVSQLLSQYVKTQVGFYAGSAPKDFDKYRWQEYKRDTANRFKRNVVNLLVATKAFGMGIDKPNIRYTVHYGIPGSIESFYQEAGRAGRDREQAECYIVFSNDNERINDNLLDVNTPLEKVQQYIDELDRETGDDISRMLFFHVNSFRGIEEELLRIQRVLSVLYSEGNNPSKTYFRITVGPNEERNDLEKAIHRLVLLGVIEDYTVDYSSNEYDMLFGNVSKDQVINNYCNYVRGYNEGRVKLERLKAEKYISSDLRDFIYYVSKVLLEFIYDTIERGRRRGIREMVQLSKAALTSKNKDKEIRSRVIRYFESTFSIEINEVLESQDLGFEKIIELFEGRLTFTGERLGGIRSSNEAAGLRGQVSRYLESTPDHPGLLFLRSLSEMYSKAYDQNIIELDFIGALDFAQNNYFIDANELVDFTIYFLMKAFARNIEIYNRLLLYAKEHIKDVDVYVSIMHSDIIKDEMRDLPLLLYADELSKRLLNNIKEI